MLSRYISTGLKTLGRSMSSTVRPQKMPLLVSPQELTELFRTAGPAEDIAVLDASWHMPNTPRNAKEDFVKKRIPGARYFDLDEVASPNELGLKHMMPSGEVFAAALSKC